MAKMYWNKRKIAVLLSTYNGQKYLAELIESIMNQSFKDFTLYIRDDGSSDNTLEIINYFVNIYPDQIIVIPSEKNIGSKSSFLMMIKNVDSDYYMFADQDDVWLPSKIMISYNKIQELESYDNKPIIVHTDLRVVDTDLNLISESYWDMGHLFVDIPYKFPEFCHYNDITGCAMIFNRKLKEKCIEYLDVSLPYYIHHDHYLGLLTLKFNGIIEPIHISTINFRRHDNNQTQPFKHNKSILKRPKALGSYIKDHYSRYKFFKRIHTLSLISYICAKFKVKRYNDLHNGKKLIV